MIRFLSNCRRKSVLWHQSPGHYFSKAKTGKKQKQFSLPLKNSTCQNQFRILAVFTPFLLNIQFLHGLLQSMTNSVKEIVYSSTTSKMTIGTELRNAILLGKGQKSREPHNYVTICLACTDNFFPHKNDATKNHRC